MEKKRIDFIISFLTAKQRLKELLEGTIKGAFQACLFFALCAFFLSSFCFAGKIFVWNPGAGFPKIVLPYQANLTAKQSIQKYLHDFSAQPVLAREISKYYPSWPPPLGEQYDLSEDELENGKTSFAVMANDPGDLLNGADGARIHDIIRQFEEAGARLYVVPLVYDVSLTPEEAEDFRLTVVQKFNALLALGGDNDITPSLYGQRNLYAENTRKIGDVSEIKLIQTFLQFGTGVFYGICRGNQILSVALQNYLIQDIAKQTNSLIDHTEGRHQIRIEKNSLLYKILGKVKVLTNSFHHQAVFEPGVEINLTPVARSVEEFPIIEAIELPEGRGLGVQFHPERWRNKKYRKQFIETMVEYSSVFKDKNALAQWHLLRSHALSQIHANCEGFFGR